MKKLLSVLVISVALILPMTAHAAGKVNFTCEKSCVDSGSNCLQTCKVAFAGGPTTLTTFKGSLVLSEGLSIKEVKMADGFTNLSNGTSLTFQANAAKSEANFDIATIVINVPKDAKDCSIGYKNEGGETTTVEITIEEEIVKTGVTLPMAILACGVVAAGVVYFVSKKNTKMYKI